MTERLLESYEREGGTNHVDGTNLPSKHAVAGIAIDLLRLLFPGFFDERPVHSSEVGDVASSLLHSVLARLESEIRKSLKYAGAREPGDTDPPKAAHALTRRFLGNLPRIRELLLTDTDAAFKGDPAAFSRDEVIVAYPCIEAIAVQRLAHELYLENIPLIPRIMTEWAHSRTGIDLHPGASMELRGQKRHPTPEDRVTVYAGATIIGGDTIVGAGSTIGASVFLTRSVPANSLVVPEATRVRVTPKYSRESETFDCQI